MPSVPIFTAQGGGPRVSTPLSISSGQGVFQAQQQIAGSLERVGKNISGIAADIQKQRDTLEFEMLRDKYDIESSRLRLSLPSELVAAREAKGESADFNSEDYLKELGSRSQDFLSRLKDETSSQTVKQALEAHATHSYAKEFITAQTDAKKLEIQQNVANLNRLEETSVIAAAVASPTKQKEIIDRYNQTVERLGAYRMLDPVHVQQRQSEFQQKVLLENASILSRTPEGREQLYANAEEGIYKKLDQDKLSRILKNAADADLRAEGSGRRNEVAIKAAQDDREIEISTLTNEKNYGEASRKLEFYAESRMLKPEVIERLRTGINNPKLERISDAAIAGRVALDVIGTQPKTTMAEIDSLYEAHTKGLPGLSLADATKYKSELRNTLNALKDDSKKIAQRDQNQVEQLLRADFGLRPDLVQSAMHDNPNFLLYSQFLRELTTRSNAFYGDENPMAIYNSMKQRINAARDTTWTPDQLKAIYPDWKDLERARNTNQISEEVFQKEKNNPTRAVPSGASRVTPTPIPPPVTPTPAKRKSGNF